MIHLDDDVAVEFCIERQQRYESLGLPDNMDYQQVLGLSSEVRQKLQDIRPANIGQAGRISGITPAAISLLLVHLKKRNDTTKKSA